MIEIEKDYQTYIHLGHYARWNEEEKRRETWEETVNRAFEFLRTKTDSHLIPDMDMERLR